MKRYIKSNYHPPIPRDTIDIEWVAERIEGLLKYWSQKYNHPITTEDVIEAFMSMNDEYDDFWARGLRTVGEEKDFINELLVELRKYGIDEVIDNTWT